MANPTKFHDERTCSVCRDYAQRQAMPWWLWLVIAAGVVVILAAVIVLRAYAVSALLTVPR